jgi:transcriptional regulator with XRE-family HTH domain
MKDYKKFLEEVTIKGNPGIPGEPDKTPGDKDYLKDLEDKAKERLNLRRVDSGHADAMPHFQELMRLSNVSRQYLSGKEKELENLAKEAIMDLYGEILIETKLDIKLVKTGREISEFMSTKRQETDEENQPDIEDTELEEKPKTELSAEDLERIEDKIKDFTNKQKIINSIIQGEAKNTKHILHSDIIKNGIKNIYGDEWEVVFQTWDSISKIADKLDWIIPIDDKSNMMSNHPEGFAGAVHAGYLSSSGGGEGEGGDEDGGEDGGDEDGGLDKKTFIIAIGIDFPMLIHEAVKGVYQVLSFTSLPSEDDSEEDIMAARQGLINVSSYLDEAEDFRTGPQIAADLRDFIGRNSKVEDYPNMREWIFSMMLDRKRISEKEFLSLFRGILNETREAREKIDSMIDELHDYFRRLDLEDVLPSETTGTGYDTGDEYGEDSEDFGDMGIDFTIDDSGEDDDPDAFIVIDGEKIDLRTLSKKEMNDIMNQALDRGDRKTLDKLGPYIRESKRISLKEALNREIKYRESLNIKIKRNNGN